MPTSRFFPKTTYQPEQELIQNLTDEMIAINGVDVYYIPRAHVNIDPLFLQDPLSRFDHAIKIAVYLKTFEGFNGDGDLMTRFGFSVQDRMTLSLSIREFQNEVGSFFGFPRPQEGDLIYFPQSRGIFEIKFTEHEGVFYQSGSLAFYDLTCEKFEYSSEKFDTGIIDIDNTEQNFSLDVMNYGFVDEDGAFYFIAEDSAQLVNETFDSDEIDKIGQNEEFRREATDFGDFVETDPFSESGSMFKT